MQRFYIHNLDTTNFNIKIEDKDFIRQILKVLRWKIWDKFVFFNGEDFIDYIFELKNIDKKFLEFEQVGREEKNIQNKIEINLFQAIPNKIDKIENIIKNGTQIWVSNFLFFKAERSQKLVISEKKLERLKKIIVEASEQCGRNTIPEIVIWEKPVLTKIEWQKIFLHTKNNNSILLKDLKIDKNEIINIFVWPEGGFSDDEVWKFERNDFKRIYLWENILRTELAWICSVFYLVQNNLSL